MGESDADSSVAERAASVPRRHELGTGPLDSVKIDLAVALVLLPVLWLVLARLAVAPGLQLAILGSTAGVASGWIIWRTRRLLRCVDDGCAHAPGRGSQGDADNTVTPETTKGTEGNR